MDLKILTPLQKNKKKHKQKRKEREEKDQERGGYSSPTTSSFPPTSSSSPLSSPLSPPSLSSSSIPQQFSIFIEKKIEIGRVRGGETKFSNLSFLYPSSSRPFLFPPLCFYDLLSEKKHRINLPSL